MSFSFYTYFLIYSDVLTHLANISYFVFSLHDAKKTPKAKRNLDFLEENSPFIKNQKKVKKKFYFFKIIF